MIRKKYIDTSEGQCHVRFVEGEGLPVVFLHQVPSSSRMFEAIMNRLGNEHSMYAIDTPGFGASFDPVNTPTMKEYCDWLLQIFESLSLERFHLFGHHTGSSLAIEIAHEHPSLVSSLTMIGPFAATAEEKEAMRESMGSDWSPVDDGSHLMMVWNLVGDILGARGHLELHHRETLDTLRAYHSSHQAHESVWDQDFISLFKQIECPMLIMCAPDDVLYPFFNVAKELRPDATYAEISGKNYEPDLDSESIVDNFKTFIQTL
jgi:pimeloyl-ACP methyl ester carboxylesterase